jgi:hypothetical protein
MTFTAKTDVQTLKDSGGGASFIGASGIYDVTLKIVSVSTNEHNARSINFNVDYKGNEQVIYGLKLDKNDGTEHFDQPIFHRLLTICDLGTINSETQTHNLGKDKTPTDLLVFPEFTDMDVKVRVQKEYYKSNGEIKYRLKIKGFYRAEDGATAAEIQSGTEAGIQIKKDEKYSSNDRYSDGLTKEVVDEWLEAKKNDSRGTNGFQAQSAQTSQASSTTGFPG